ncbi:MAG TPA: site-2 protease family protein [Miltoncostaeaceae bacterium]|nr:site-2 protease family protein [Miltoncostaeaceae bacterium]
MTSTFRLGRIAGIEVGVNWTWILVAALVTWSLASVVFPNQNPGLADGTYWAMAVAAALLFFGSILLHELGHAIQARRDEVEIDGITLWLLGGVAKFRGIYRTPGAEFRIAIAGPLVTAVIVAVLLVAAAVLPLPAAVGGVVAWLAYINLIVLVFNLIPALPLDGGRLLHAGLWRSRNSLAWATRVAAGIGRTFGFVLIGLGVATLFLGAGFGGLWLAVIGWFIAMAADAEARHLLAREALGGLRVRDLMATDVVAVRADETVGRFMDETARGTRFTTYPVLDGGRPVGLVSFRCVADVPRDAWDDRRVTECMTRLEDVPVVRPDDPAEDALTELATGDVHRALVMEPDGDGLVGILSVTDLTRAVTIGPPGSQDGRAAGHRAPAGAGA